MTQHIYLDNAATTRCDERVAQLILKVLREDYGNPSSLHRMGFTAECLLNQAAQQVSALLHCMPEEIVFTSGATEANNLALRGACQARRRRGMRVVSDTGEHASVRAALENLSERGFDAVQAPLLPDGRADAQALAALVDANTILVSCMLVNNETGALNDVAEISRLARQINPEVLVHCDAVQAVGKLPLDLKKLPVDLLSMSGHKLYAPKGVGMLFIRKGTRVLPLLHGGAQQRGIRPGTENTASIAGLGLACAIAAEECDARLEEVQALHAYFCRGVLRVVGARLNMPSQGSPYICNVSFEGMRGETLLHYLSQRGIFVSSGSACTRGAHSHVLQAMGLSPQRVDGALRISFSHETRQEELDTVLEALESGVSSLAHSRKISLK